MSKESLRKRLYELGAVNVKKPGEVLYTLKSGITSPLYVDCRLAALDASGAEQIGELLYDNIISYLDHINDDHQRIYIGGAGVGASPIIGSILSVAGNYCLPWQGFIVREKAKDHGRKKRIEGHIGGDGAIVLVEDVITGGSSICDTLAVLKEIDLAPISIHCIVDREEGGSQYLRSRGHKVFSLFTASSLTAMESVNELLGA